MLMDTSRNHANSWLVVSFKEPCLFNRSDSEVWLFNPGVRYVLNTCQLKNLEVFVETSTELRGSSFFKPLNAGSNIAESRILVQRLLDRGIGDMLFMTGPMAYMHAVTAGTVKLDMYALSDRSQVLLHNPLLRHKTTLAGPLIYDSFRNYDHHWLVNVATEYDSETDQLNVYDCLFQQLGLDYTKIDPRFKRPNAVLSADDHMNFDALALHIFQERQFDLRRTPYYVVAPLSHGSLRSAPYMKWVELISKLQEMRPVVVLGSLTERMPSPDVSAGEFMGLLDRMGRNVVNLVSDRTPLRVAMSVIANSALTISLDSGLLYVAQAFRTPAISVWGTHHPGVRLGYDKDYMDLAIWKAENCRHCPCFSYQGFPTDKCPRREAQTFCEVFNNETFLEDVMEKLELVEGRRVASATPFEVPKS
jgi:hypothetical protein